MNPPRLVAVACLLLVLLAFVGRLLSNPEVEQPGPPALPGAKIVSLAAQVAVIGDFDREFNVNLENPFVPFQARRDEKEAITAPKTVVTRSLPKPGPPVVVEAPKLVLPRAKPIDLARPECLGVISHGRSGREVLIVRMPGGDEQQLERGARISDWELLDLGPGGARFRDPKGVEQEVHFVAPSPSAMLPASDPAAQPPADGSAPEAAAEPPAGQAPPKRPAGPPASTAPPADMREGPIPPPRDGGRRPRPQPAPEMVPKPPGK